jgi:hypothetical protein
MVQRQPASDQEPEKGNFGATRLTTEEECGLRWHSNSGHEEETQAAAAQRSANPSTKKPGENRARAAAPAGEIED